MKQKTHSGAKKRLRATGSGLVKRHKAGRRHLLVHKAAKRKHNLAGTFYIDGASAYQVQRLLVTGPTKTK